MKQFSTLAAVLGLVILGAGAQARADLTNVRLCLTAVGHTENWYPPYAMEVEYLKCTSLHGDTEVTDKMDACAAAAKDDVGTMSDSTLFACLDSGANSGQVVACADESKDAAKFTGCLNQN